MISGDFRERTGGPPTAARGAGRRRPKAKENGDRRRPSPQTKQEMSGASPGAPAAKRAQKRKTKRIPTPKARKDHHR